MSKTMENVQLNVNLSFKQLVDVIKHLSPKEKLRISEAIWEDNMEIPEEQKELVRSRVKRARKDPGSLLDWDKASSTLRP